MRLVIAALMAISVADIATAADLLQRDIRVYEPAAVERGRIAVRTRHCSTCTGHGLPWGGLRKVHKAQLPWGGLRKVHKAELPWGGLDCP